MTGDYDRNRLPLLLMLVIGPCVILAQASVGPVPIWLWLYVAAWTVIAWWQPRWFRRLIQWSIRTTYGQVEQVANFMDRLIGHF